MLVEQRGKRVGPSQSTATVADGSQTGRIFITGRRTNIRYLVDTGADVCVYLRSRVKGQVRGSEYALHRKKIFSKVDLVRAYNQILVAPEN